MQKEMVINKEELQEVLDRAVEGGYDFFEFEGVLNDNYVICDAYDLIIAGEKVDAECLVIYAKPVTSWTSELIAVRADGDEASQYIESWTGVAFND